MWDSCVGVNSQICTIPTIGIPQSGSFLFLPEPYSGYPVKVDMANSKETSFGNTISSTLSLITVLCEDLFEAIIIHKEFCGEKVNPKPSITLLSKTDTCGRYDFNIDVINNDEYNALQKELLMLFEAYCIFGFQDFYKICFVFWWK